MTAFLIYIAVVATAMTAFIIIGNRMLGPQEPLP